MSTGVIIAIVVGVLLLIALFAFVLPRSRAKAREHQVQRRRDEVAGAHRDAAQERMARAELAEREAKKERAEAELHETRAKLHADGLADDDLDRDHKRFARTNDHDGDGVPDEAEAHREAR